MTATFDPATKRPTTWKSITVVDDMAFEIEFMGPSFQAQLIDWEQDAGLTAARLRECVVGWRGLLAPDDSPISFSWDMFEKLVVIHPQVLTQCVVYARKMYTTSDTQRAEKSNGPPSDGSTGGNSHPDQKTESVE